MDTKQLEVKVLVLEERLGVQAIHLKDVDECCGKLKGSSTQEFKVLGERIVAIEHDMNTNCKNVEVDVATLEERLDSYAKEHGKFNQEISSIHDKYFQASIGVFLALVSAALSLIMTLLVK